MAAKPATFDELADLLNRAATVDDIFGDDPSDTYRRLVKLCHPDLFPAGLRQVHAQRVFVQLTSWWQQFHGAKTPAEIVSPCRRYMIVKKIATGDLADVYLAKAGKSQYVLKVCRSAGGNPLLVAEDRWLRKLTQRSGDRRYREYIANPIESFRGTGERVGQQINVFTSRDGFYTLDAIRRRHAVGLDARHLAWIFKRMLAIAGFAHHCGVVHGAILPPHVLLHAKNHGLQLLDWIHAVSIGHRLTFIPSQFRDWYPREVLQKAPATPATDIFLAAKTLLFIAGGDPLADRWPDCVPRRMQQFFNTCLYASPRMRPQNAWELHEEFDDLLRQVFGPPQYHPLVMN